MNAYMDHHAISDSKEKQSTVVDVLETGYQKGYSDGYKIAHSDGYERACQDIYESIDDLTRLGPDGRHETIIEILNLIEEIQNAR